MSMCIVHLCMQLILCQRRFMMLLTKTKRLSLLFDSRYCLRSLCVTQTVVDLFFRCAAHECEFVWFFCLRVTNI